VQGTEGTDGKFALPLLLTSLPFITQTADNNLSSACRDAWHKICCRCCGDMSSRMPIGDSGNDRRTWSIGSGWRQSI